MDGSGLRAALFLSRIYVNKGILNLPQFWAHVAPAGWRLVIAGPDDGGHFRRAMSAARALGIDRMVEFAGELDGQRKSQAYSQAGLFVLPTLSENFGIVVARALSHGVPVITTRGAPWADLEAYRCGWWVDIGVEPLAEALRSATSLDDAERRAMGERGREYARRFDWEDLAPQTLAVYRWILGKGEVPDCVRMD